MKKYLILMLTLTLTFAWVWAGEEDAKEAISSEQEAEWQPEYGPKGDLLNPPPAVVPFGTQYTSERQGDPVINTVTDIILFENFSNPQGWDGSNPPAGGWAIIDSGTNPWNTYDWMRVASSSWGVAYARVYDEYSAMTGSYPPPLTSPRPQLAPYHLLIILMTIRPRMRIRVMCF
jgi:hypothetical protein